MYIYISREKWFRIANVIIITLMFGIVINCVEKMLNGKLSITSVYINL